MQIVDMLLDFLKGLNEWYNDCITGDFGLEMSVRNYLKEPVKFG